MKDRVATHNTLHAALYTPDKHCTTGFKQLVKDDIIRLLQKEKPACCRDGNFRKRTEAAISVDRQELSCYNNNRNIYELKM